MAFRFTKKPRLASADDMFLLYFDRWYDDQSRELRGTKATRPDMMKLPQFIGNTAANMCPLTPESATDVMTQISGMQMAALEDWAVLLKLSAPVDSGWIAAFDQYYDKSRVIELIERSNPEKFSNDYLVTVCEFGAVLGQVMIEKLPRLEWVASWPYWESAVFDSQSGNIIPVFHWAIKKFSSYGIDDGFSMKLDMCIKLLLSHSGNK